MQSTISAPRPRARSKSTSRTNRRSANGRSANGRRDTAASRIYDAIAFGSVASVAKSLRGKSVTSKSIIGMLNAAHAESPTRLQQLASGIIAQRREVSEERQTIRLLVGWAVQPGAQAEERRRALVRSYRTDDKHVFLVHGISELPRADATAFMKSYFAEGGTMAAVAEWLAAAGAELARIQPVIAVPVDVVGGAVPHVGKRRKAADVPLRKGWGLGDIVSGVGDAISDGINVVGDAIAAAARDLGAAVSAAANWTVAKTTDLVRGLLAAGKSVSSILNKALAEGTALLEKFVRAVIGAGKAIGEVLSWALEKGAVTIRAAIAAVLSAGKTVYQVLSWAAVQVAATTGKIIKALQDAGKTVTQIMADVARFAAAGIRKLVAAVWTVVQDVGQILAGVAQTAASVIRTVLEGLFMCGVNLAQNVAGICLGVVAQFRKGFMEGLIALGHLPLDILKAAVASSLAVVGLAFAALIELWGGHRSLTAAEMIEARRVFGWSIALERVKIAVASIPADIVNWANGERPFTTMYVINFASWAHIDMRTLIHELTHVWQAMVAGPVYMVEALHSQAFGRGYEVTDDDIAAANGNIRNLEREQQAVVVERYWAGKWGGDADNYQVYEPLAKDVYRDRILIQPGRLVTGMLPLPRGARRQPLLKRFTLRAHA